jgi:hypothetical protein
LLLASLLLRLRTSGNGQDEQNAEERCDSTQLKISHHLNVSLIAYGRRPAIFGFICCDAIRAKHPAARTVHRISLNRPTELVLRESIQCV